MGIWEAATLLGSSEQPVLTLRLTEDVLSKLKSTSSKVTLELGDGKKSNFLKLNNQSYELTKDEEKSSVSIYSKQPNSNSLIPCGVVTHKLVVVPSTTDRMKNIRNLTEQAEKEKMSRTTAFLDLNEATEAITQNKKSSSRKSLVKPIRKSATTIVSAQHSSPTTLQHPSPERPSVKIPDVTSSTVPGVPVRKRLVHLLAVKPRDLDALTSILGLDSATLKKQLDELCKYSNGIYQLKPETYKELRPFEWHAYTFKERETAIKNAQTAFTQLLLPEDAPEWKQLVPPEAKLVHPATTLQPPKPSSASSQLKRGVSPSVDEHGAKKPKSTALKSGTKKKSSTSTTSKAKRPQSDSLPLEIRNHSVGVAAATDTSSSARGGLGPAKPSPCRPIEKSITPSQDSSNKTPTVAPVGNDLNSDHEMDEVQLPLPLVDLKKLDTRELDRLYNKLYGQHELLYKKITHIAKILQNFKASTPDKDGLQRMVRDVQKAFQDAGIIKNQALASLIAEKGFQWYIESLMKRYLGLRSQVEDITRSSHHK